MSEQPANDKQHTCRTCGRPASGLPYYDPWSAEGEYWLCERHAAEQELRDEDDQLAIAMGEW